MFSYEDLRNLLKARPFIPFRLHLSEGNPVEVRSPEVVLVSRRFAVIGLLDPDANDTLFERWSVVWYLHVTRVEMLGMGPPPFSKPPESMNSPTPSPA
jgi:hypothetical protein